MTANRQKRNAILKNVREANIRLYDENSCNVIKNDSKNVKYMLNKVCTWYHISL